MTTEGGRRRITKLSAANKMIETIYKFLLDCPVFADAKLNINYLAPETRSFSVDTLAAAPIVRKYSDGAALRQYCFAVSCRDVYDADKDGNCSTAQLFEQLAAWIEQQNSLGIYPDIQDGEPVKIEVTQSAAIENTASFSARTSMQLRFLFIR